MIQKMLRIGFFAVVVLTAGYFSNVSAQNIGVSGSIGNGTVTRGTAARATVTLNIPGGLHTNSSRPGGEYAIPTTVRASSKDAKIGGVTYPRGVNRKFEFSERPLNVYEGRVRFTFNVTVPSTFRGRTVRVNVSVRYQACTNEVCYAPRTKNVTLTANVN
ncbi:MAG: protein-disulfide reductase DsbD domain-containing protein [Pyrinomonadaceae bacterium]